MRLPRVNQERHFDNDNDNDDDEEEDNNNRDDDDYGDDNDLIFDCSQTHL